MPNTNASDYLANEQPFDPVAFQNEVISRLEDYLRGHETRQTFWHWFAPAIWNHEEIVSLRVTNLIYEIQLAFIEFIDGERTEEDIKAILRGCLDRSYART